MRRDIDARGGLARARVAAGGRGRGARCRPRWPRCPRSPWRGARSARWRWPSRCAVAVAPRRRRRRPAPAAAIAPGPRALFAAAAVLYVAMGLWYASRLRVSGDEPHYLLMAQSLWREGDLDLADNLRARGLAREHAGAGAAALRRAAGGWPAVPGPQPGTAVPAGAGLRGRRAAGSASSSLAARRAGADRRRRGGSRVAGGRQRGGGVLRLAGRRWARRWPSTPSTSTPRCRRRWPPAARWRCSWGRRRSAAAIAAALLASALPWLHVKMIPAAAALGVDRRGPPCAAVRARAFVARGRRRAPPGYLGLLPRHLRDRVAARASTAGCRWAQRGSPVAGAGRPAARPLVRAALARAGVPARARRPARGLAPPALAARAAGGGDPGPRAVVADVVGRTVPAGAVPRPAGPAAARSAGPSRRPRSGPRALALGSRRPRPGRRRVRRRAPGGPPAPEPRRPARPGSGRRLSGDADVGRYLPSLVAARPDEDRVAVVWVAVLAVLLVLDALARRVPRVDRLFTGTACRSCCSWPRAPASTTGRARGRPDPRYRPPVRRGGRHEDRRRVDPGCAPDRRRALRRRSATTCCPAACG